MSLDCSHTVEGIARVVRVDGDTAWFEPEQTTSCGHCASSATCGAGSSETVGGGTGIGSIARRIEFRRFALDNANDLHVGDRVVVGVDDRSLLKASLTAYAIPLLMAFVAGGIAHSKAGDDLLTMISMFAGLFAGLVMSAVVARHLNAHGELSPHFLRRAAPGETCHTGI